MIEYYHLYNGMWIEKGDITMFRKLTDNEIKVILGRRGGYLVRNTYDFDCQEDTSFWYVVKDCFNGLQDIPSKYRARLKKALDSFDIRKISKDELINHGYEVHVKAMEKYKVKAIPPTFDEFKNRIVNMKVGYDLWGCFHKKTGTLAAFAINCVYDNIVDYETMKYHPDFLAEWHPSYGLIYEMNRYYLQECRLKYVVDGVRSITEHSNIQPFLIEKFKFRKAFCKMQISYRPWFGLGINILFPFRKWIKNRKAVAILRQEAWAREMRVV